MIINVQFHLPNETFGWIVVQILAAETARQNCRYCAPCVKDQRHG